jgi:uncharacterized protein (DUF1810 family)
VQSQEVADDDGDLGLAIIQDETPRMELIMDVGRGEGGKAADDIAAELRGDIASGCTRLETRLGEGGGGKETETQEQGAHGGLNVWTSDKLSMPQPCIRGSLRWNDARMSGDPYQLQRFLHAQRADYSVALRELRAGRKQSHWIWYIFPQVAGLGRSSTAQDFAIGSAGEAKAYLDHPVLGERLRDCAAALLPHKGRTARDIMGTPDDLKLRSSMTLFAAISEPGSLFHQVLDGFYQGVADARTLAFLSGK